jgi:hypothetical protein
MGINSQDLQDALNDGPDAPLAPAERTIETVLDDIDQRKGKPRGDGFGRTTPEVRELADLAVELAGLTRGLLGQVRAALVVTDDDLEGRTEQPYRGVLGQAVQQFTVVVRDRRGDSQTDEATVVEALSFVFNLRPADVRANLHSLGGSGVRWAAPISTTAYQAFREGGNRLVANDQFTGYSTHVGP